MYYSGKLLVDQHSYTKIVTGANGFEGSALVVIALADLGSADGFITNCTRACVSCETPCIAE